MNSADVATPDFPSDIVIDILLRLPVRSLCRFKCVAKPWRYLISNPRFAKKHFNRNNKDRKLLNERLFSISKSFDCYSIDLRSPESTAVQLGFRAGRNLKKFIMILSSCHGLLLLAGSNGCLFLVNPTTGECKKVPNSPFFIDSDEALDDYGFGYDSSVDDYKVVSISLKGNKTQFKINIVSVYNLRTNSWRRIESSPYRFLVGSYPLGVFLNGAFHYLGMKYIIVFNLASENFHTMPLPNSADGVVEFDQLDVNGGCLYGVESLDNGFYMKNPFNIWVMREYGVGGSWVKFKCNYSPVNWIVSSRAGKLLFCMGTKLAFYDVEAGEIEELKLGCDHIITEATTYEESLIRLQEEDDNGGRN